MDIEELSKSQTVLLTLLTSFVTSIATGIVTVSLMQQAPPVIAQTVNRVVERTVEKLVPQKEGQVAGAATTITKEKTVIIRESDLIPVAVGNVLPSVLRLYSGSEEGASFIGLALVVGESGMLLADSSALVERGSASVALSDGTRVTALVTSRNETTGIASLLSATTTEKGLIKWHPASLGSAPGLGASVIAISGRNSTHIASGIVTASAQGDSRIIETDVSVDAIIPGAPLIDTSGSVVGVSTGVSRSSQASGFVSIMNARASN